MEVLALGTWAAAGVIDRGPGLAFPTNDYLQPPLSACNEIVEPVGSWKHGSTQAAGPMPCDDSGPGLLEPGRASPISNECAINILAFVHGVTRSRRWENDGSYCLGRNQPRNSQNLVSSH